jgi:hypothetical protein
VRIQGRTVNAQCTARVRAAFSPFAASGRIAGGVIALSPMISFDAGCRDDERLCTASTTHGADAACPEYALSNLPGQTPHNATRLSNAFLALMGGEAAPSCCFRNPAPYSTYRR